MQIVITVAAVWTLAGITVAALHHYAKTLVQRRSIGTYDGYLRVDQ